MSVAAAPELAICCGDERSAGARTAVVARYLENLAALYRCDPAVAAGVEATPFAALPALESTRDGRFTARIRADDGRDVYLHSRYAPADEAAKLTDGLKGDDQATLVIQGAGLGYALEELERRRTRPVFIVVENDLATLKAALCVCDLAGPLADGRVTFIQSSERGELHAKLSRISADLVLGLTFVTPPCAKRVQAEFHERVRAALTDYMSFARMQIVTLLKTSHTTFRNIVLNLPHYLTNPGVVSLENVATGSPAIVVAAGPSLTRNARQLIELQHRAVIIAVQTVFKFLLSIGVRPHFVTSLDFHEVSAEFFRGVEDVGECVLVAEPKATPEVLNLYPGAKRVLHHRFLDPLLRGAVAPRGALRPGSTVANLAFYLAEHLGCDPVLFVGQDLAFSAGLFYMPGSPIERIWGPELGRFQTLEMKQWDRIVRNRPILRKMRDLHGCEVYTDDLLFTYGEQFAKDFAASSRRIIQASEGGLRLERMEVMTLREAAEAFCVKPLPESFHTALRNRDREEVTHRAVAQLEARIAELDAISRIATEMRGLLGKLADLTDRPREFNKFVARVDELRVAIGRHEGLYNLIVDVSPSAALKRHQADRRIAPGEQETPELARRRLQRDQEFVSAFLEGCEFLQRVLPEARDRLRALESGPV